MVLSENIQVQRKRCHLTQEQLAAVIGVTQNAVSRFERGTKVLSVAVLEQLADVFDCSTDCLLGREETGEQNQKIEEDSENERNHN